MGPVVVWRRDADKDRKGIRESTANVILSCNTPFPFKDWKQEKNVSLVEILHSPVKRWYLSAMVIGCRTLK